MREDAWRASLRCSSCRFCTEIMVDGKSLPSPIYACHGGPPVMIVLPDGSLQTRFANVPIDGPDFWCGAHQDKPA